MQIKTLYVIYNNDGTTTVTPNEISEYDHTTYRLIADDGMELVKGEIRTPVIDTDDIDGWAEELAQEIKPIND